jgi:hypothetical protein
MKCVCCNELLEDNELSYRDEDGNILDTCITCLNAQDSYLVEDEYIENLKDIGIDL